MTRRPSVPNPSAVTDTRGGWLLAFGLAAVYVTVCAWLLLG